jgi:hypothetical protein
MSKKPSNYIFAIVIGITVIIIFGILAFYKIRDLNKAHSTFENYYAFRGCTQLLEKTSSYGVCTTKSGQTIKIVLYKNKWYLDGDLPTGIWGHLN